MRAPGVRHTLTSGVVALLLCCPTGASANIVVTPGGGDDGNRLQAALDAASAAGPGAVVELAPGTFRVGRPLVALNFDGTIRGAGMRRTSVIADGSVNPGGLFPLLPPVTAAALHTIDSPILFSFYESDVDRAGRPVGNRRSQQVAIEDLTLGARGRTVAHFDINANADTQRLFSHVWIAGYRPDWTDSRGRTPGDTGRIAGEHARVSTVRVRLRDAHFDGRNHARAPDEPGGAFDPNPDVRNGIGVEGGFVLLQPPPDPVFFFRPINAALSCERCRFSDLPGQAGIFLAQPVGRQDPAWRFGRDAAPGRLDVTDSVFERTEFGVLTGDVSDVAVAVGRSTFHHTGFGVLVSANFQSVEGGVIGYPASVPSRATVSRSSFADSALASMLSDAYFGPGLLDVKVSDSDFALRGQSQTGIAALTVDGARIAGNDFSGRAYAGVAGVMSSHWRIQGNDFCDLSIPQSAESALGFPPNESFAPIVFFDSVDTRSTGNACAKDDIRTAAGAGAGVGAWLGAARSIAPNGAPTAG